MAYKFEARFCIQNSQSSKAHIHTPIKMSQTITVTFKQTTVNKEEAKPVTIVLNPAAIEEPKRHHYGAPVTIALSYTGTNGTIYSLDSSTKDLHELRDYLDVLYRWMPEEVMIEHQSIRTKYSLEAVLQREQAKRKLMNKINTGENCHECGDAEGECCCDDPEESTRMDYSDFIDEMKGQITALTGRHGFMKECKALFAAPLIKDRDCPVLMEPLKSGASSLLPCKHILSTKALYQLRPKGERGELHLECPLCRCKFESSNCMDI